MADGSAEQTTSRNRVSFSTTVKLSAEDSEPEAEPSQLEKLKSKIFRRSSSDGSTSGAGRHSQTYASTSTHRESNNPVVDEEDEEGEGDDDEGHQEMSEAEFRRRNLEMALYGGINDCLRFQTGKRGKIRHTGNKRDKHEVYLYFKRGYATCWFDEECRSFLKHDLVKAPGDIKDGTSRDIVLYIRYLKALTKHFTKHHEKENKPDQKTLNEQIQGRIEAETSRLVQWQEHLAQRARQLQEERARQMHGALTFGHIPRGSLRK